MAYVAALAFTSSRAQLDDLHPELESAWRNHLGAHHFSPMG
jgi:hypothetical protein